MKNQNTKFKSGDTVMFKPFNESTNIVICIYSGNTNERGDLEYIDFNNREKSTIFDLVIKEYINLTKNY